MSEKKLELSDLILTNQDHDNPTGKDLNILICGDLPKERTVLILGGKK